MKKILIFILFAINLNFVQSQTAPFKYWVEFKDKNNSIYSISNPNQFLSTKSIERRNSVGYQITEQDFPVNSWYLDSLTNMGAIILTTSRWHNGATIFADNQTIIDNISQLSIVKNVVKTAKVKSNRIPSKALKNKTEFKYSHKQSIAQVQINNCSKEPEISKNYNYGNSFTQVNMIRTDYLHQLGYKGNGMLIGVLDAGFYNVNSLPSFDSLWLNEQIFGIKDFVNPNDNFYEQSTHGMMVLSTMGGNLPGQLIGTAPRANYFLIRTEDAGSELIIEEDNWVASIEFADSLGVDIINSSLGYTTFDDNSQNHNYSHLNGRHSRASLAALFASRRGIIVCNSAGNSAQGEWKYIGIPADADSILTVGAVDYSRNYASFSSVGPTVDGRLKPDISTMGEGSIVQSMAGDITSANGTSFSSPILAGSVACLWQAFPHKNNFEIMNAIKESADKYYNPDTLTGYGIPNFEIAYNILNNNNNIFEASENYISTYPNPFNNEINIDFNFKYQTNAKINIYDTSGKLLFSKDIKNLKKYFDRMNIVNMDKLEPGVYIVKVITKYSVFQTKVIKQ